MSKYKIVKQQGIKDCGAACLLSILRFYGGNTTLENVRELTETNRNGTNFYKIILGANKLGLNGEGLKLKFDKITKLKTPFIAHVVINNSYNHFVVVYEINKKNKTLIIGDPAKGIVNYKFEDFKKIWTNVAIEIYPSYNIIKEKIKTPVSFIFSLLKKNKYNFIMLFILSVFFVIFNIAGSFYFKYILDYYFGLSVNNLYLISIIFLFIIIIKNIFSLLRDFLGILIQKSIDFNITFGLFKDIMHLPYKFYKSRTSGEIIERMSDISKANLLISKIILNLFVDGILSMFALLFLYFISEKLFFLSIIVFLIYLLIFLIFYKTFSNLINNIYIEKDKISSFMVESINGFESVKSGKYENYFIEKFQNKYITFLRKNFRLEKLYIFQKFLKDNVYNIGVFLILFSGVSLVNENYISIGELITFNSILLFFLDPIKNIIDMEHTLKDGYKSIIRILDIKSLNKEHENSNFMEKFLIENIKFKNLKFSYNDKYSILNDINIEIKKDSKILVSGDSGSGKSTLMKILCKYFDIEKEMIFINNIDINYISEKNINEKIRFVSQNEFIFNDSLFNNVVMDSTLNYKKFLEIANCCCLDKIIKFHNKGYNMRLLENGFNLSGGEKQRVILARSLASKFDVLILDESLSEVDTETEKKILLNLFNIYKNKIIIYISHRTDNLFLFDKHLVFNKNKLNMELI